MSAKYFLRDQRGSVLVEVTIMLSITLILVFGAIDFLLLFYQWKRCSQIRPDWGETCRGLGPCGVGP